MPNFEFTLTKLDRERCLPQISVALEKQTELASRKKYPAVWKWTDRFRRKFPSNGKSSHGERLKSAFFLFAGLVLFIPALTKPVELLIPLIWGAASIIWGAVGLLKKNKPQKNRFEQAAFKLLANRNKLPEGCHRVAFTEAGMAVTEAEGGEASPVPFSSFAQIMETQDLYLLTFDGRVLLLQKKDLKVGSEEAIRKFLSEKAPYQKL